MAGSGMKISGEIFFAGNAPKSPLAEPSILVVQLEDCRKVGAPSIDIGKVEIDAHEVYVKGKPLTYCLNVPTFVVGTEYQEPLILHISAVLNIGWIPDKSKNEWIRIGDYLTDTSHVVVITDEDRTEKQLNIEVVLYS